MPGVWKRLNSCDQAQAAIGQHVSFARLPAVIRTTVHIMAADANCCNSLVLIRRGATGGAGYQIAAQQSRRSFTGYCHSRDWVQIARLGRRIDMLASGLTLQLRGLSVGGRARGDAPDGAAPGQQLAFSRSSQCHR